MLPIFVVVEVFEGWSERDRNDKLLMITIESEYLLIFTKLKLVCDKNKWKFQLIKMIFALYLILFITLYIGRDRKYCQTNCVI